MLLAGEMLDRVIFGRHHFSAFGARRDIEIIYRISDMNPHPLLNADKDKHRKFFYRNGRKALKILNAYMNEIYLLAHELKSKKTLDQKTVHEIIENFKLTDEPQLLPDYKAERQSRGNTKQNELSHVFHKDDLPF